MPQKYIAPNARSPIVGQGGVLTPEWQRYLNGIQDLSGRVSVDVDPLAGGASLGDVIAKVNELIAAAQAASQMES